LSEKHEDVLVKSDKFAWNRRRRHQGRCGSAEERSE
jgi:hypothetical protein